MNTAVWIASGLLAAAYLFIGGTKLLKSKEQLSENPSTAGAAEALSATSIKLIGSVEVAGALGLILPWLTGIARILTPAAALGLALLQVGAAVFHGRRAEYKQWPVNAVFLAVAVFIAAARALQVVR
ncbi:DoxX family protein [Mycolicibacterium sp. CBMA 226]|uniref:DoxX family protein n=1 Tax=Mycolicibacterium sp. CBMA 226 TaxID=2606611 RepID=UPI0012DF977F|nr:DoxX family protein [Mycolicibacterium sp. CBMA 226]MUL75135.1 DoxX family protein [Mycolicibacterium sp. CBMA 226]